MKKKDGIQLSSIPKKWIEQIALSSGDDDFQNDIAQITSKSMLKEITDDMPSYAWNYNESVIIRNATTLSLMIQNMALENPEHLKNIGQSTLRLATLWENLARLHEKTDPVLALMNSAVCYQLAGYQANATCLARKASKIMKNDNSTSYLSSLFLQRLFLQLRIQCQQCIQEPTEIDNEFEVIRKLGLASLADGYQNITDYFLRGNESSIEKAEESFSNSEKLFSELFMIEDSNLVRKIRSLVKPMIQTSTWKILGDIAQKNLVWDRYLRLLARGIGDDLLQSTSISEIWPSQKNAIDSGLFNSNSNKVIKMPTSAGKTRIAELVMVQMLAKNPGKKCIYVAPYRALVSELEDTFLNLFGDLGFRVSTIVGTYEQDPFEEKLIEDADVLVLTPEKLDLVLRSHSELLDDVKLFILDEGHIIDDDKRGIKLELLLTRLKRKLINTRFIFISAVLSEETVQEYLLWFNGTDKDEIKSDWRPSIQQHARFEWSSRKNTGLLRYEPRKENKLIDNFVPGIITHKKYRIKNKESGRYRNTIFPTTAKTQTAAELAYKFSELGPVLVFTTQVNWVLSIANLLLKRIELTKDVEEQLPSHFQHNDSRSLTISKEWLGNEHPITQLLQNGIAIHHGRLPDILRRSIESDFRDKKFRVIVSTNTLAQGVNLPIKTILIHSCRRRRMDNTQEMISVSDYWNVAGRAGRAGQETEGTTVHIINTPEDQADYSYYLSQRNKLEHVRSALFQILNDLAGERLSINSLREKIDAEVLALLMEEGGFDSLNKVLDEIIESSLVNFQSKNSSEIKLLVQGFKTISEKISQEVPAEFIGVFSSTGLSSRSCLVLKNFIELNSSTIKQFYNSPSVENNLEFLSMILDVLSEIIEMEPISTFDGDVLDLLKKWIMGDDINELISSVKSQDKTEIAKFIEEYFGYKLPWGISSFLQIAQKIFDISEEKVPNEMRYLSSMVKYGVPTYEASWCMMMGIPFRKLALRISSKYLSLSNESEYSKFVEWISSIDSESLQKDFGIKSPFLEDISNALNRNGVNPLLKNKIKLEEILETPLSISGIRFENRYVAANKIKESEIVILSRDYDNAYDRNAIKVFSLNKSELGFLSRNMAQYLAPYLDCGIEFNAKVFSIIYKNIPEIKIKINTLPNYGSP